jgi:hypothetical protein
MDNTKKGNLLKGLRPLGVALIVLAAYLAWPSLSVLAWEFHGRMTGGGSICKPSGCVETSGDSSGRITHGFELHCAPEDSPNNLEVNDHIGGHRFHLEVLDDVFCYTDPLIDPRPPAAGFNTYVGRGTGRYDGASGFCADWIFTDAGEPGDNDKATIRITDTPGAPDDGVDDNIVAACTGNVLLVIGPATLTFGNHQAHKNP